MTEGLTQACNVIDNDVDYLMTQLNKCQKGSRKASFFLIRLTKILILSKVHGRRNKPDLRFRFHLDISNRYLAY